MRACALATGLVVLASGCGGTTRTDRGRALFNRACSGCHTLTGHDSRAPGGDLAIAELSVADIDSFVRVMPVHLSSAQVDAVAAYVHAVAARSRR
jgi:mono/diheme cytochrome c family protein